MMTLEQAAKLLASALIFLDATEGVYFQDRAKADLHAEALSVATGKTFHVHCNIDGTYSVRIKR